MSKGRGATRALRAHVMELLREGAEQRFPVTKRLMARRDAEMLVPAAIGDYTDFYAGIHHAMNVGSMFRPDSPLLPNYKYIPIGYHGRASSIVASGTSFHRPRGQAREDPAEPPHFRPSKRLAYQ